MISEAIWALVGGFWATLFSCLALVLTKNLHGKLSMDTAKGVHKFHKCPTPRVGGVGIMAGCILSLMIAYQVGDKLDQPNRLFGLMLISGLPAFGFGILEDITKQVGVRTRLFATMGSGLLAWYLTGYSITHVDIWGVDAGLSYLTISIIFTAFAVSGVANSFNIIDGFNGLAAGTLTISLCTIGLIAHASGDSDIALIAAIISSVVVGFSAINFPLGKIFLGDGGAYLLGFLTAWLAVMLPARNPEISPWAPLLACGYPVLEVLFSMWRKHHREGSHPGEPDKVHLHMLIYRRISKRILSKSRPEIQNALTSIFAWLFAAIPAAIALLFRDKTIALETGFIVTALIYRLIYVRITQFTWKAVATGKLTKRATRRANSNQRLAA